MKKLPPLNGLRYFLVAAQNLSFKDAAEKCYVTQAAISQHIKTLEESLGCKLFHRSNRQLTLTEDGQRLLPYVAKGFEQFEIGVSQLKEDPNPNVLNMTILQTFAVFWLVPRLHSFREKYPEIQVRLQPNDDVMTFDNNDLDLALRYGQGTYKDLESRYLMADKFYLVCHPHLMQYNPQPETLLSCPILRENYYDSDNAWKYLFQLHDISEDSLENVIQIEDATSTMVEAALAGQGLAMVRHSLVNHFIERGQLVKLFEFEYPTDDAYYLVAPSHYFKRKKIMVFENWLREQLMGLQKSI